MSNEQQYPQHERRVSERVTLLEAQFKMFAERLEENQTTTNKLMDRLDQHIITTQERDSVLQQNLALATASMNNLSTAVVKTNETLDKITKMVDKNDTEINKSKFFIKIMIGICVFASGLLGFGYTAMELYDSITHQNIRK